MPDRNLIIIILYLNYRRSQKSLVMNDAVARIFFIWYTFVMTNTVYYHVYDVVCI